MADLETLPAYSFAPRRGYLDVSLTCPITGFQIVLQIGTNGKYQMKVKNTQS